MQARPATDPTARQDAADAADATVQHSTVGTADPTARQDTADAADVADATAQQSAVGTVASPSRSNTGALILAAGMSSRMGSFKPMLPIGTLTIAQRVILTFREAGAGPIVLITGHQAELLEAHVRDMGVTCLHNAQYATTQMLDSIKIGLAYLIGYCDRLFLTPIDIPLFSAGTLRKLAQCSASIAAPTHGGRKGHPILLSGAMIPHIAGYTGPGGLAGAIRASGNQVELIEVDDEGILLDANTPGDYQKLLGIAP